MCVPVANIPTEHVRVIAPRKSAFGKDVIIEGELTLNFENDRARTRDTKDRLIAVARNR